MPSFGLKQKLGVAVLTAALFALSAAAASANEAWVWACHGPNGGAIGTAMVTASTAGAEATSNCSGDDTTGAVLRLPAANPAAESHADVSIQLPQGVTTKKLAIYRNAGGSSAGVRYRVTLITGQPPQQVSHELLDLPLDGVTASPDEIPLTSSGTLKVSLICKQEPTCAAPASVDVFKIAVLVDDSTAPYGGVSRNTPVDASSPLLASSTEQGVGFSHADAVIATAPNDGAIVRNETVPIGNCTELSPGDATIDLPLDATRCKTDAFPANFSNLDTRSLPEGTYYRRVTVYDAVGNSATLLTYEPFEVWHPVLGSPTQTLSIGSSSLDQPTPQPGTNPKNGGVQGSQATSCRSPRLSVSLGQKPLRVSKSVVVLQYGKRYRFEGRLSCVVNHRRVSAPKRTKVELLNKVGKKTVKKTGPRIAGKGRFKISLKYPRGSRTLIFRFRNADGQRSQVSIKIKVEKKKKSKR